MRDHNELDEEAADSPGDGGNSKVRQEEDYDEYFCEYPPLLGSGWSATEADCGTYECFCEYPSDGDVGAQIAALGSGCAERRFGAGANRKVDPARRRPPNPPQPLKMALIGPNFRIGGVLQHALALAKFLDPDRVRVTAFAATDPIRPDEPAQAFPAPYLYGDRGTLERLADENDVLLLWGGGFHSVLKTARSLRVYVAHGESAWTRSGLEHSAGAIDHVIAVSDRVRRRVCRGFPTTTILNGVDASRLASAHERVRYRARFGFGPRDFVLGSVGRFTSEKRHELLIESVARLPKNFKLLLVGAGRRYGELCELANRRIPGRFAICAAHDYLGDVYGAMDAFALVSEHEGFGLVLAEAMLCGRPVMSTNVGCVPEILCDRINGLVISPCPDAIAEAADVLRANPSWARGMAAQGHALARRRLHASRMAEQYEDLLLSLVHRRRTKRGATKP